MLFIIYLYLVLYIWWSWCDVGTC